MRHCRVDVVYIGFVCSGYCTWIGRVQSLLWGVATHSSKWLWGGLVIKSKISVLSLLYVHACYCTYMTSYRHKLTVHELSDYSKLVGAVQQVLLCLLLNAEIWTLKKLGFDRTEKMVSFKIHKVSSCMAPWGNTHPSICHISHGTWCHLGTCGGSEAS